MTQLFLEKLTLPGLLPLAYALPANDRHVAEVISGREYDAERFAAEASLTPGLNHEFRRPDGEAVAAGGFVALRPGVYRTWFCAPEWAWSAHGAEITRICRQAIETLLDGDLAHRIETVTLAGETRTRQWYEKIGLTYESTIRGYGSHGEDLVMYVALKTAERTDV